VSSIFQGLVKNGVLPTGPGPAVSWFRSLPFNAAGEIVVGNGPAVAFANGVGFNAAGALVGVNGAYGVYGPGATAAGANGEVAGGTGPAVVYHQGVPYRADGGYSTSGGATLALTVAKNFTLTPAQISATQIGYQLSPLFGTLGPDKLYAGGTIVGMMAYQTDMVEVRPQGGVRFPGLNPGSIVIIDAPQGIHATLSFVTNTYSGTYFGIWRYFQGKIGVAIPVTLTGTAP
jgi:hypothetical protein